MCGCHGVFDGGLRIKQKHLAWLGVYECCCVMKTADPASVTGNLRVPFIILIPHMFHPACHVLHPRPTVPTINSARPTTFHEQKKTKKHLKQLQMMKGLKSLTAHLDTAM